jgi:hypothetical protein
MPSISQHRPEDPGRIAIDLFEQPRDLGRRRRVFVAVVAVTPGERPLAAGLRSNEAGRPAQTQVRINHRRLVVGGDRDRVADSDVVFANQDLADHESAQRSGFVSRGAKVASSK